MVSGPSLLLGLVVACWAVLLHDQGAQSFIIPTNTGNRRQQFLLLHAAPKRIEVTAELVRKTAQLAQLDVREEELTRLVPKIKQFLDFVDQMQTVQDHGDGSSSDPLPEVGQVVRPEGSTVFPNQDGILRNMPTEEDGYLRVPKVAEEET